MSYLHSPECLLAQTSTQIPLMILIYFRAAHSSNEKQLSGETYLAALKRGELIEIDDRLMVIASKIFAPGTRATFLGHAPARRELTQLWEAYEG